MPLPPPPPRLERGVPEAPPVEERCGRGVDDKLKTLWDYRRVAMRRSGHATTNALKIVQLHVLQEFWDICHSDVPDDTELAKEAEQDTQVFLAMSVAALSGKSSVTAIQFQGTVQGHPAKILVYSSSSHTFISTSFATKLSGMSSLAHPLKVKIADGQLVHCDSQILELDWAVQGCHVQSDAKVLALAHFDTIVGMDWLARFSPMQVDWDQKWMLIHYEGSYQLLHGDFKSLRPGSIIQIHVVVPDVGNTGDTSPYPAKIVDLL